MELSFSEYFAVCQPAHELLANLEWEVVDLTGNELSQSALLGRDHFGEVVLRPRLEEALRLLNQDISQEVDTRATVELKQERLSTSLMSYANREH